MRRTIRALFAATALAGVSLLLARERSGRREHSLCLLCGTERIRTSWAGIPLGTSERDTEYSLWFHEHWPACSDHDWAYSHTSAAREQGRLLDCSGSHDPYCLPGLYANVGARAAVVDLIEDYVHAYGSGTLDREAVCSRAHAIRSSFEEEQRQGRPGFP